MKFLIFNFLPRCAICLYCTRFRYPLLSLRQNSSFQIYTKQVSGGGITLNFIGLPLYMEHVLDNPAWNALNSGNRHLANGNQLVKYFDKEVSPFVGSSEYTHENLEQLYQLLPDDSPRLLIAPNEITLPKQWKVLGKLRGFQMVHNLVVNEDAGEKDIVALTDEHIPQMLALTKLTNPGPFASRTIEFGHYHGVLSDDKLVAMAGQRLHAANYTEVSAVCTHPNHLGNGYARRLLQYHIHRMQLAGTIPFLHVRYDNDRAIKVYEDLGFAVRIPIWFHFIQKDR